MKILVTGGAGFIGSHLTEVLLERGHEISVVDDLSQGRVENLPPDVPAVKLDIRDRSSLHRVLARERPEILFHLAAQMNVRRSIADPGADADVNILGMLNVLQVSAQCGVRRIVFASSGGAVYGEQSGYPCREEDSPRPSSPYGIAKLAGEEYGRHFALTTGLEFTALRLANVYGPRQNPHGEAGVVAIFFDEMRKGRSPAVFGDGEQTRDFVWVGDVAQAFLQAMMRPAGTYNIGTGRETSVNELFFRLKEIVDFSGDMRREPRIVGEVRRNALSFERARQSLGWAPCMSLEKGLLETCRSMSQVAGREPSQEGDRSLCRP